MARALTLAAGIVLLAGAGIAFLLSLLAIIPGGEKDADTWPGVGILLGAALAVGGLADLLIIRGLRPRALAAPGPVPAASAAPTGSGRAPAAGGADPGSILGPALNEVGYQLFGVAGGLLAALLTALLEERRRRARRERSDRGVP